MNDSNDRLDGINELCIVEFHGFLYWFCACFLLQVVGKRVHCIYQNQNLWCQNNLKLIDKRFIYKN